MSFIISFPLQECEISDEEKSFWIDLKPFMNPTPYTVPKVTTDFLFHAETCHVFTFSLFLHNLKKLISNTNIFHDIDIFVLFMQNASMPRMFRLFRGLGLRHLIIVDGQNRVKENLNSSFRNEF